MARSTLVMVTVMSVVLLTFVAGPAHAKRAMPVPLHCVVKKGFAVINGVRLPVPKGTPEVTNEPWDTAFTLELSPARADAATAVAALRKFYTGKVVKGLKLGAKAWTVAQEGSLVVWTAAATRTTKTDEYTFDVRVSAEGTLTGDTFEPAAADPTPIVLLVRYSVDSQNQVRRRPASTCLEK